jgi:hypothetical protein
MEQSTEETIDVTGIEFIHEKGKIIIIAVCRSPSGVIHELFTYLTEILEQVSRKYRYIIIVGDLNINIHVDGNGKKQL